MPITPLHPVRRLSQQEFADLSYAVMGRVFEIHNEFGRLFDEKIYKRELARLFPRVELEFSITMSHESYSHPYFLDVLIAAGGPFEFKAVETLTPRHRGQLYNYLLLLDLAHGKLVNMKLESVEHEFVNATLRPADRYAFEFVTGRWNRLLRGAEIVLECLVGLLRDWGTGLEISMYEAALTHFLSGEDKVLRDVAVRDDLAILGQQPMRFVSDDVAFRLTAFAHENHGFEEHVRRLLRHVDLRAILWVNLGLRQVTFATIERG